MVDIMYRKCRVGAAPTTAENVPGTKNHGTMLASLVINNPNNPIYDALIPSKHLDFLLQKSSDWAAEAHVHTYFRIVGRQTKRERCCC